MDPQLSPDHSMVRPATGTSHHLHIAAQLALVTSHHNVINHMPLLSCGMLPGCQMPRLLCEPSIHDGEVVDSAKLKELLT